MRISDWSSDVCSSDLAVVLWSYPRGGELSKEGETAIDVTAYAAHLAAMLGAHIIKVKPPSDHIEQEDARKVYQAQGEDVSRMNARIHHVVQSACDGRPPVLFSAGPATGTDA